MRASPAQLMAALRDTFDLSVDEAWEAYRRVRDAIRASFDHDPGYIDLSRHPRITAREVRRARIDLVAEREAEQEADDLDVEQRDIADVEAAGFAVDDFVDYEEFEMTATTKGHTPRRED